MKERQNKRADKYIFYICLIASLVVGTTSFLLPPTGMIDPSCLKFIALLLAFSALGIAGQNLAEGKGVTFSHGDTKVEIDDDNDEN